VSGLGCGGRSGFNGRPGGSVLFGAGRWLRHVWANGDATNADLARATLGIEDAWSRGEAQTSSSLLLPREILAAG
jgi:hypothetical protein